MSLTVKVFFERGNGPKEIRRFPCANPTESGAFGKIKEKIKQLYPALASGNFSLFWQDPDGDRVAFSTDEELRDAVSYVNDGVLRVYIPEPMEQSEPMPKQRASPKPPTSQEQPGTSERQQQQQQQKQQQEQEQQSQKSQSKSAPKQNQRNPPPRSDPGPQVHVGVTCDGCEGPVVGIRYKCCVCPDFDLCEKCEAKGLHAQCDMYKITQPRVNPLNFLPPHMSRYLNRFMRNMTPEGTAHTRSESASSSSAGASASASSASSSQAQGQGSESGSYNSADARAKARADYDNVLRNVGANIAAFLDPFGIDVTYDVHHNGQSSSSNNSGSEGNQHGRTASGGCSFGSGVGTGVGAGMHCPMWNSDVRKASTKNQGKTGESEGSQTAPNQPEPTPMETEGAPQNKDSPMSDAENKTGGSDDGWTLIDEERQASPPAGAIPMPAPEPVPTQAPEAEAQTPPEQRQEPTANTQRTNIYPNLRVQQSVEQMLVMGFTDTDGWLTKLLTETSGDIGSALDIIKARATQQLESLRH